MPVNLTAMSAVTENASLTPAYLNSKMDVIAGNINSINTSTQSYEHLSAATFSVYRSGNTGTLVSSSDLIGRMVGKAVNFAASGATWQVHPTTGAWIPLLVHSSSEGTVDMGSATTPIRAVHVNHLASLLTMASVFSLSAGEFGLEFEDNAMHWMVRSGDTIYDLKASTISVAVS